MDWLECLQVRTFALFDFFSNICVWNGLHLFDQNFIRTESASVFVHVVHCVAVGYNTWYDVTGDFDEALLRATVDAHVRLRLADFGYNYWNLDDLWSGGRYPNGSIFADPAKFPSKSLRPLADYVHSQPGGTCSHCGPNLLFGAYSDRGTKQCGPGPGSFNHTTKDANSFAAWTVDYLKEVMQYLPCSSNT